MIFFFFKQKTAYEMRISDWSSDVCSSDLMVSAWPPSTSAMLALTMPWVSRKSSCTRASTSTMALPMASTLSESVVIPVLSLRSEEHTSELQSLMRISYAVFCLKKKRVQSRTQHIQSHKHLQYKKTFNILNKCVE